MDIQFIPSKTYIVDKFWRFWSHLEWPIFCQNSWVCHNVIFPNLCFIQLLRKLKAKPNEQFIIFRSWGSQICLRKRNFHIWSHSLMRIENWSKRKKETYCSPMHKHEPRKHRPGFLSNFATGWSSDAHSLQMQASFSVFVCFFFWKAGCLNASTFTFWIQKHRCRYLPLYSKKLIRMKILWIRWISD